MSEIEFEPGFSTKDIPGKCIKCLAEREYGSCLRELLKGKEEEELEEKYEALVTFLESPQLRKLCDETERYLSEGREVKVRINLEDGELKYDVVLD